MLNKTILLTLCLVIMPSLSFAQNKANISFNPAISVLLDLGYANTKINAEDYSIAGFDVSHPEGYVEGEGFYSGHQEITISSPIDNNFYGQTTLVVAEHDGEAEVELEEAYIQTLGLGQGVTIKAGRLLPIFGYLNEKHLHTDFFIERPLAYQAFLGGHLIDDGLEASVILPNELYTQIGAGVFRGTNYPGTSDDNIGLYTAHLRIGDDLNHEISWRLGAYYLHAKPKARSAGAGHGHGDTESASTLSFTGDSNLYALSAKLEWAPQGNLKNQKLELRAEYFMRDESGFYDDGTDKPVFDGKAKGFYVQGAYQFEPNWSIGTRYEKLTPETNIDDHLHETSLDAEGHKPKSTSISLQYTFSEFSRLRFGYANADLSAEGNSDKRFFINFQVSLGAHAAHQY